MIAFLHTSPVHIERFDKICKNLNPTLQIQHFVNEGLLENALKNGFVNDQELKKQIDLIESHKPQIIICTCSTLGEACSPFTSVKRIDEPVITHLVENYQTVLLVYAAHSTKEISEQLINKVALSQNKTIEIVACDCTSSWTYFKQNDFKSYSESIAETIRKTNITNAAIFLAQASMDGVPSELPELKDSIFTSPYFGVRHYLKEL